MIRNRQDRRQAVPRQEGQTLLVERLACRGRVDRRPQPLLLSSSDTVFDRDGLAKVAVRAEVVGHERGKKIRVFKFKPKRGYKRTAGHRQELTRIEITEISNGS